MTIELAVGAPSALLSELCPLGAIELCFAHLMRGDANAYESYDRKARTSGRFVILDNGIMERGVAASLNEMLYAMAEFQPALVTPPEVLHDGPETLRLATAFAACLSRLARPMDTKLLAAAHGNSFDEWCRCFEGLLALPAVTRIGIPYDVRFDVTTRTTSYIHGLERLVTRRIELCEWVARTHPYASLHLFGLAHPSELQAQRCHAFVASLDTSLPVMAATRGIRYDAGDYGPYVKYFLDLALPYDDRTVRLARSNVRVMTEFWLSPPGAQQ